MPVRVVPPEGPRPPAWLLALAAVVYIAAMTVIVWTWPEGM